jgi:hypothetical protein
MVLVSTIGVAVSGLIVREVMLFWQWKDSPSRSDRGEWTRIVRMLRDK